MTIQNSSFDREVSDDSANELSGVLAMMPAFATPDAVNIRATETIAVDNLKEAVDRIVRDGINNIATTGT